MTMLEPLSEKRIKEIRERAERNQERYTLYAAWDDLYEVLNEVGRLKDELEAQHKVIDTLSHGLKLKEADVGARDTHITSLKGRLENKDKLLLEYGCCRPCKRRVLHPPKHDMTKDQATELQWYWDHLPKDEEEGR